MSIVDDVLKALDRIEMWRTLQGLPSRMDALEARMAEIDAGRAPGACPKCGKGPLRVADIKPHPVFNDFGGETHELICDACGFKRSKVVTP